MSDVDMKGLKSSSEPVDLPTGSEGSTVGVPSEIASDIYIDPEREKACLRKFDLWLVPVAFVFLVLSSLDRINVRAHNPERRSDWNEARHPNVLIQSVLAWKCGCVRVRQGHRPQGWYVW